MSCWVPEQQVRAAGRAGAAGEAPAQYSLPLAFVLIQCKQGSKRLSTIVVQPSEHSALTDTPVILVTDAGRMVHMALLRPCTPCNGPWTIAACMSGSKGCCHLPLHPIRSHQDTRAVL